MIQYLHCQKGFVESDHPTQGGWINIECPDTNDMLYLVEKLKVPASFLEALGDVDERPRYDTEAGWSLTVIRIPMPGAPDSPPYKTVPIGVLASPKVGAMVTVCFFKTLLIQDFIAYSQRRELTVSRSSDFVLHILFSATYWFLTYLRNMNRTVTGDERNLEHNVKNSDLLSLMRLQQSLVFFNTSLRGNQTLLERLHTVYGEDYDHDLHDDLETEMKQADNTVNVYTDILEGTMDTYGSIISNNVNLVMKRMTSITIVLMVPTLVASFYGMNVQGLPWAMLASSFWIVILIAFLLTIGTYIYLRRIKWF